MADTYDAHADLIVDQLLDAPDLLTEVDEQFADRSDDGYGQWIPTDESVDDALAERASLDSVSGADSLTEQQRSGLRALRDAMNPAAHSPLLAGDGRGLYVHRDEDPLGDEDGDLNEAAAAAAPPKSDPMLTARKRWWAPESTRGRVLMAASVAIVALVAAALMIGDDGDSTSTEASTTAPFTVPTMTETSRAPQAAPGSPAADGPIGIKKADSRCTAGSTDPMQAFDGNLDTAWMCVPAYGTPGTVLRVEFDGWYLVTGVSIVPGWNRINHDSSDEWLKHKTVSVVEYQFNDPDETALAQETLNLRDEVHTPIDPPVLASAMTITITGLDSPTGPVADVTTLPGGQGATLGSPNPVTGDLKDFAVSTIDIIGRRPA